MSRNYNIINQLENNISKKTFFLFLLFEILIVLLTAEYPLFLIVAVLGLVYSYFIFRNTFLGILTVIIFHLFVIKSTEELNVFEILFGLTFLAVISGWFFGKKLKYQERILNSNTEYLLFFFIVVCFFSVLPAIIFKVNLFKWFRELVPFMTLLLFFPIVDQSFKKKYIILIICAFLALGYYVAFHNLLFYKSAVETADKFWQLTAYRQTANEPILFVSLTLSLSLALFTKSKKILIALVFSIALFAIALFATFSRGYWLGAIISISFIFILSPKNKKIKIFGYLIIFMIIGIVFVSVFFGQLGEFIFKAIGERFTSIGTSFKDVSLVNRIKESEAVIEQIKSNPIMGYGLGYTYWFKSLIPREMPTWYVHNGYLFVLLKLGLLGILCLLGFYSTILIHGIKSIKKLNDDDIKAILIALVACLFAMLPLNITSPQFIQKDSLLIITLSAGIIESINRNIIMKLSKVNYGE